MKKKYLIASVSLACVLAGTSCNKKESTTTVTESTYSKELSLSKKFGYTGPNKFAKTTRDYGNIVGGDGAGAAYGAYYGMMFAGPWGALCGTIAFGGYVSMSMWDDMPVKNINPTGTGSLSNNPYEYVGQLHNSLLQSFITDFGQPINSLNMYAAYQFDSTYMANHLGGYVNNSLGFVTSYSDVFSTGWNSVSQSNFDPVSCMSKMYNNGQIDSTYYSLWSLNYGTILSIANSYSPDDAVDSIKSYYPQFVNIVMQSTDISDNDKQFILSTGALNTYEAIYHIVNNN
jgi:hypothetical protein